MNKSNKELIENEKKIKNDIRYKIIDDNYKNKLNKLKCIFNENITNEYKKVYIIIDKLIKENEEINIINEEYNKEIIKIIEKLDNKNIKKIGKITKIKKTERIVEKILIVKKKLSIIKDIIRTTIICKNWENILKLIKYIFKKYKYNKENNYHYYINNNSKEELNYFNIEEYKKKIKENINKKIEIIITNIKITYFNINTYYADIQIELKIKKGDIIHICELQIITDNMYKNKNIGHKYYKFNRIIKELFNYFKIKYKKEINKKKNYTKLLNIYKILNDYYDIKWYKNGLIKDLKINNNKNIIDVLIYLNNNNYLNNNINIIYKKLKNGFLNKFNNQKNIYNKILKKISIIEKSSFIYTKLIKLRIFILNEIEKEYKKKHQYYKKNNNKFYLQIIKLMKNIEILHFNNIDNNINKLEEITILKSI